MKKSHLFFRILFDMLLLLVFIIGLITVTRAHEVAAEIMQTTYKHETNFVTLRYIYIASASQICGVMLSIGSLVVYAVHSRKREDEYNK